MILINIIIGGLFLLGAIHFYKKYRETKAEFSTSEDTGYRTLYRMNLFGCIVFSLVVLNNVVLILRSLVD